MKTKIQIASMACATILAFGLFGAADAPQKISEDDLWKLKYVLTGPLGGELGAYHTVEGVRIANNRKSDELLISVDTLDGKKLSAFITLVVRGIDRPEIGTRCVLRGYEWGGMEGFPTDPENPVLVATIQPAFYSWFNATKVVSKVPAAK